VRKAVGWEIDSDIGETGRSGRETATGQGSIVSLGRQEERTAKML